MIIATPQALAWCDGNLHLEISSLEIYEMRGEEHTPICDMLERVLAACVQHCVELGRDHVYEQIMARAATQLCHLAVSESWQCAAGMGVSGSASAWQGYGAPLTGFTKQHAGSKNIELDRPTHRHIQNSK